MCRRRSVPLLRTLTTVGDAAQPVSEIKVAAQKLLGTPTTSTPSPRHRPLEGARPGEAGAAAGVVAPIGAYTEELLAEPH